MKNADYIEKNAGAVDYAYTVVPRSWPWARLTAEERERWRQTADWTISWRLSGTAKQRRETVQTAWHCFLMGVGYNVDGWREPDAGAVPGF